MTREILIGSHAFLGEAGAIAFLWVLVELIANTGKGARRARIAAIIGTICFFLSWVVGGFYYVEFYGHFVKPLIKDGPQPWAHSLAIETKEHIFFFVPLIALLTTGILERFKNELTTNISARRAIILLSGLLVLMTFAIAGLGFIVSSGYRAATDLFIP